VNLKVCAMVTKELLSNSDSEPKAKAGSKAFTSLHDLYVRGGRRPSLHTI
jgi:hypothetical protein